MNYNDIIGAIGVAITLIAYMLNIFSLLSSKGITFLLMNFIGAGLACYASVLINYIPFIVLEGAWSLISLVGLVKSVKGKGVKV